MSSRLDKIRDWEERARKAGYAAARLAKESGVSRQQLSRYFRSRFGVSAQDWLQREKLRTGYLLLQEGRSVKEVAGELGFLHATHFSRAFRRVCGVSPTCVDSDEPPHSGKKTAPDVP